MSQDTCHCCLKSEKDIVINGQFRIKNGKFVCYKLCVDCARELSRINPYSDRKSREAFLTEVKKNAKKNPTYG